jgi:PPK2 family polyphosphate:nucleotide phosphotransferase
MLPLRRRARDGSGSRAGKRGRRLVDAYRVADGRGFRLAGFDPKDTGGIPSKERAVERLRRGIERLAALQEKLYAQDRWAVLVVLQAMDAAGKDSVVKHVFAGVNPQGCQVWPFKAPSEEELDHDFLWRVSGRLPGRGQLGIFNRSHYEEVLVVRVHPELLERQRLPAVAHPDRIWKRRFEDINAWERYLADNGVVIRKFFLHVSKEQQRRRFVKRLDDPEKNWKFSLGDVAERGSWKDYMRAYEDAIRHTATPHAPWFVVPADNKWFTRLVVAEAIVETLEGLGLEFPPLDRAKKREIAEARRALEREGKGGRKGKRPVSNR